MSVMLINEDGFQEPGAGQVLLTAGPYKDYRGVVVSRYEETERYRVRVVVYGRALEIDILQSDCKQIWFAQPELERAIEALREDAIAAWWFDVAREHKSPKALESAQVWALWEDAEQEISWCLEHLATYLLERLEQVSLDESLDDEGAQAVWAQLQAHYLASRCKLNSAQRIAALDAYHTAKEAQQRRQRRLAMPAQAADSHTKRRARICRLLAHSAPALKAYVKEHIGFELSDDAIWLAACYQGLNSAERQLWARYIGLTPVGVLSLSGFSSRLERVRPQVSHAMIGRHYHDPPEFLTIAVDAQRGTHYGLWYDDPNTLPTMIASYQTPCLWPQLERQGTTLVEVVLNALDYHQEQLEHDEQGEDDEQLELLMQLRQLVEGTLRRMARHGLDVERYRYTPALMERRLSTIHGLGVSCPDAHLERPHSVETLRRGLLSGESFIWKAYQEARQACEQGKPYEALALAHDFHAMSAGDMQMEAAALSLFVQAYKALGFELLAHIAQEHFSHRAQDRPDAYVLQRSPTP